MVAVNEVVEFTWREARQAIQDYFAPLRKLRGPLRFYLGPYLVIPDLAVVTGMVVAVIVILFGLAEVPPAKWKETVIKIVSWMGK